MHQFAREKDDLVLLRDDRLVAARTHVRPLFQASIVNAQFTPFELPGLAMKEVDKGQVARGHAIAAIVAVEVEEIAVVAGGDLDFHTGDGELLHTKRVEDLR